MILHFFHKEPYPIIDFRALWSVSLAVPPQYSFGFWWLYVNSCRNLSKRVNMDMRILDRALWQYSIESKGCITSSCNGSLTNMASGDLGVMRRSIFPFSSCWSWQWRRFSLPRVLPGILKVPAHPAPMIQFRRTLYETGFGLN